MQTVDNTKKKTKFFLLLICSAASQIISELFSEKLFRSQLCFFDDVDYTEAVDYTIPKPSVHDKSRVRLPAKQAIEVRTRIFPNLFVLSFV